jgi:hypothetical protein
VSDTISAPLHSLDTRIRADGSGGGGGVGIRRQVERTKHRPIAAGLVTPNAALVFVVAQLLVGLGILLEVSETPHCATCGTCW